MLNGGGAPCPSMGEGNATAPADCCGDSDDGGDGAVLDIWV